MARPSSVVLSLSAGLFLLVAGPARAQLAEVSEKRFEITPFAGYQWGGSFETDAGGSIPAGELNLTDSFAWGAVLSFLAHMGSALELTYLRQDTDVEFNPVAGAKVNLGGFAINYLQIGGRQEFGRHESLRPFFSASLGIGIMDPAREGLETSTRFSWSLGGGAKYMFSSQRLGIRSDITLWGTPVSSGTYGGWCNFYGCFVAEGTAWITQGQISGGLVFAF